MEYEVKRKEQITFKEGRYYLSNFDEVYQIIYDGDRGYALLNINTGTLKSDFHEDMEYFTKYTTITEMKPLRQIQKAIFEEL